MNGTAKLREKIDYLNALIDDARTPAGEREAAVRARARVAASLAKAEPARAAQWEPWFKGDKYEATRSIYRTSSIAALVRADLKLAVKVARTPAAPGGVAVADPFAAMPAGARFSVTTPHHGSIRIKITGLPADWAYAEQWSDLYRENMTLPTPALNALAAAVRDIANAYNYDDSDIMTDYFNTKFYVYVTDETGVSLGRR